MKFEQHEKMVRMETALRAIAEYPNSNDNHHPDECLLAKVDEELWDEDSDCTCGYWSLGFTQLKIIAMEALK